MGYIYQLPGQEDCFIGIKPTPDEQNQVRLGTIFLRNFYAGLDFDNNKFMLGLKVNDNSAQIIQQGGGE